MARQVVFSQSDIETLWKSHFITIKVRGEEIEPGDVITEPQHVTIEATSGKRYQLLTLQEGNWTLEEIES